MPDQMYLTVTLRTKVPDKTTAMNFVRIIKNKLNDHPEIEITSQTTYHFDMKDIES